MKPMRMRSRGQVTRAQARAALQSLLVQSHALDRLSVDTLARTYRVPVSEIEQLLAAERQRRAER